MKQYPHTTRILVATDCIIFGFDGEELKLLLIKRNFEPEKERWSLMGGFLQPEEDLEAGANRILYDLTGLRDIYVEQLGAFGEVVRDPVERTLSVAFLPWSISMIKTRRRSMRTMHSGSACVKSPN